MHFVWLPDSFIVDDTRSCWWQPSLCWGHSRPSFLVLLWLTARLAPKKESPIILKVPSVGNCSFVLSRVSRVLQSSLETYTGFADEPCLISIMPVVFWVFISIICSIFHLTLAYSLLSFKQGVFNPLSPDMTSYFGFKISSSSPPPIPCPYLIKIFPY